MESAVDERLAQSQQQLCRLFLPKMLLVMHALTVLLQVPGQPVLAHLERRGGRANV